MPVPTIPSAISASSIQTEFGGSNPISLSEYFSGGVNVPSGTANATSVVIPSSGTLRFSNFSGAQKIVSSTSSFVVGRNSVNFPGASAVYYGFNSVAGPIAPFVTFGSMSPATTIGSRTVVRIHDTYFGGGYLSTPFSISGNHVGSWWNTIQWIHGTTGYSVTVTRPNVGEYSSDTNETNWIIQSGPLFWRAFNTVPNVNDTGTLIITA